MSVFFLYCQPSSNPVSIVIRRKNTYCSNYLIFPFCYEVDAMGIVFIDIRILKKFLFEDKNFFPNFKGSLFFNLGSNRMTDQTIRFLFICV